MRLGQHGDTCVDNAGVNAPYVLVTSVFDGGDYRVQPGQRVMFQHGSLHEVVDHEKEPCGCPPAAAQGANEFPLAQSEGLAPLPKPARSPPAQTPPARSPSSRWFTRAADHTAQLRRSAAAPAPAAARSLRPQRKQKARLLFQASGISSSVSSARSES